MTATIGVLELGLRLVRIIRATSSPLICGSLNSMRIISTIFTNQLLKLTKVGELTTNI